MLGILQDRTVPQAMLLSNDLDAYPRLDPGAGDALAAKWGQGSAFEQEHGYYFDPISPQLASLPAGWQARLIVREFAGGVRAAFLEPNDAAISKYARYEERDKRWIRAGLKASILSLATLEYRFRETDFLDDEERERVRAAIAGDREWLMKA
ncbi:MAG: hypothetical protein JNJ55_00770 [Betaproteobacteria bacterium]|nr:hypothetical protein [Betaproteobacteria bacterium]